MFVQKGSLVFISTELVSMFFSEMFNLESLSSSDTESRPHISSVYYYSIFEMQNCAELCSMVAKRRKSSVKGYGGRGI